MWRAGYAQASMRPRVFPAEDAIIHSPDVPGTE